MIKILLLTDDSSSVGISRHILALVGLPRHNFDVHVACPQGLLSSELKKKKVKTHRIDQRGLGRIKSIRTLIKREKFDIVHSQTLQIGFYTALATIGLETKYLYTEHQITISFHSHLKAREIFDYFKLFVINLFSCKIVVPSQAARRFLMQTLGVKEWKIQVILPGLEKGEERKKKDKGQVIGYAGQADKQGQTMLLKAWKTLKTEFPHLKIVSLDGKTDFRDWQVLVLPTVREHLAENILYGFSHRKPVIATQTEGIEELIFNELTGIAVPKKSVSRLVKEIGFLLRNPKEAERIGQNGYKLFEKRHNASDMIEEYITFYSGIV